MALRKNDVCNKQWMFQKNVCRKKNNFTCRPKTNPELGLGDIEYKNGISGAFKGRKLQVLDDNPFVTSLKMLLTTESIPLKSGDVSGLNRNENSINYVKSYAVKSDGSYVNEGMVKCKSYTDFDKMSGCLQNKVGINSNYCTLEFNSNNNVVNSRKNIKTKKLKAKGVQKREDLAHLDIINKVKSSNRLKENEMFSTSVVNYSSPRKETLRMDNKNECSKDSGKNMVGEIERKSVEVFPKDFFKFTLPRKPLFKDFKPRWRGLPTKKSVTQLPLLDDITIKSHSRTYKTPREKTGTTPRDKTIREKTGYFSKNGTHNNNNKEKRKKLHLFSEYSKKENKQETLGQNLKIQVSNFEHDKNSKCQQPKPEDRSDQGSITADINTTNITETGFCSPNAAQNISSNNRNENASTSDAHSRETGTDKCLHNTGSSIPETVHLAKTLYPENNFVPRIILPPKPIFSEFTQKKMNKFYKKVRKSLSTGMCYTALPSLVPIKRTLSSEHTHKVQELKLTPINRPTVTKPLTKHDIANIHYVPKLVQTLHQQEPIPTHHNTHDGDLIARPVSLNE